MAETIDFRANSMNKVDLMTMAAMNAVFVFLFICNGYLSIASSSVSTSKIIFKKSYSFQLRRSTNLSTFSKQLKTANFKVTRLFSLDCFSILN